MHYERRSRRPSNTIPDWKHCLDAPNRTAHRYKMQLVCANFYLENGVGIDVLIAVSSPVLDILSTVVHPPLLLVREDSVGLPHLQTTDHK